MLRIKPRLHSFTAHVGAWALGHALAVRVWKCYESALAVSGQCARGHGKAGWDTLGRRALTRKGPVAPRSSRLLVVICLLL